MLLNIHINFVISLSLALALFVIGIETATEYAVSILSFYLSVLVCATHVHGITRLWCISAVGMYSDSSSVALPVSVCILLDVGRGHCAVYAGGQSVWQCS